MAEEIIKILRVETQGSERTVKSLKDEISSLRDALLNVERGSEDYNTILTKLRQNQSDLTEAMTAGKKGTEALEGSYNYLQQTMKQLRDEWKSTTDAVRRTELGEQIDKINSELKEMDATIGNFQRNVGNYANDITKALNQQNNASENTIKKLASVQKIASGLANGYAALQGATALLGVENEDLQKTFVKVQSAIALAQGIGGLKDFVEGLGDAKKAFASTGQGIKLFNIQLTTMKGALISTGIGAFVVVIGILIAKLLELSKTNNKVKDTITGLTDAQQKELETFRNITVINNNIAVITNYAQKVLEAKGNVELLTKAQQDYNKEIAKTNLSNLQQELDKLKKNKEDLSKEINKTFTPRQQKVLSMTDNEFNNNYVGDVELKQKRKDKQLREQNKELYDKSIQDLQKYENDILKVEEKIAQVQADIFNSVVDVATETQNQLYSNATAVIGASNKALNQTANDINKIKERVTNVAPVNDIDAQIKAIEDKYNKEVEIITKSNETIKTLQDNFNKERNLIIKQGNNTEIQILAERDKLISQLDKNSVNYNEQKLQIEQQFTEKINAVRAKQNIDIEALRTNYNEQIELAKVNNDVLVNLEIDKNNAIQKVKDDAEKKRKEEQEKADKQYIENLTKTLDAITKTGETDLSNAQSETQKNTVGIDNPVIRLQEEIKLLDEELRITQETYNKKVELINKELEQATISAEVKKQLLLELTQAEEGYTADYNRLTAERIQKSYDESKARKQSTQQVLTSSLNTASQVTNALVAISEAQMQQYEEGTEEHKKQWEINKKLQIGSAIISTIQGAISAFMSAQSLPQPAGAILGGILSASALAMGYANVEKIRATTYEGGGSGASVSTNVGATVTPTLNTQEALPIEYTRNIQTDTEIAEINKAQRVYVLESDITDAQRKVSVTESNATF